MSKINRAILALALAFSLTVPAFAAGGETAPAPEEQPPVQTPEVLFWGFGGFGGFGGFRRGGRFWSLRRIRDPRRFRRDGFYADIVFTFLPTVKS